MSLLPKLFHSQEEQEAELERRLLRREAQIGGHLFGPLPKGNQRQFFRLDTHTWVWHEEWLEDGQRRVITTHYHVRPSGVLKTQDGKTYNRLSRGEARNLYKAAELYRQHVGADYQRLLHA